MTGTARPIDSGRVDALGRTVKVAAGSLETRSDAPTPPSGDGERDCGECGTPTKRTSGLCRRCDPTSKQNRRKTGTSPRRNPSAELLANAVEALVDSDDWKRWLTVQSKFRSYSFGNTMLIAWQRPDATRVAGRRKWEEMGRTLDADAKPIQILAPCVVKGKKNDDDPSDEPVADRRFYRIVEVYDISDTEGEPLPEIARKLEGDAPAGMIDDLHRHAATAGIGVEFLNSSDDPLLRRGANGYAQRLEDGSKRIVVAAGMSPAQTAKTFAHELGHIQLGHLDDPDTADTAGHLSRQDKEVAAESFACMLAGGYGLDTDDYSFGYIAAWSGGDPKKVRKLAGEIVDAVRPYLPS